MLSSLRGIGKWLGYTVASPLACNAVHGWVGVEALESRLLLSTTAPVIFNWTEAVAPGQVLGIQGDNFGSNPEVWLDRIESSADAPNTETKLTHVLNSSDDYVGVELPASMADGLYAIFVKNTTTGVVSDYKFVNQAEAWQALDLAGTEITPNFTFRLSGLNLDYAGADSIVRFRDTTTGSYLNATVLQGDDPNLLTVTSPSGLIAGRNYEVYVSNGFGGTYGQTQGPTLSAIAGGGVDHWDIGVPWAASKFGYYANVYNVKTDSRLTNHAVGNGVAADAAAIQEAINKANAAGGGVVYLPAGTYNLKGVALEMKSDVVLQGDGKDGGGNHQSIIYDNQGGHNRMVYGEASHYGFVDLQFEPGPNGFWESLVVNGAAPDWSYAFYLRIKVIQPTKTGLGYGANKSVLRNSEIIQTTTTEGKYVLYWDRSDLLIKDNYFQWSDGRVLLGDARIQLEGNTWSRSIYTNTTSGSGGSNATGFGGPSFSASSVAIINNTFNRLEAETDTPIPKGNDGETILNEDPNYRYTGKVSSATDTTMVGLTAEQWTSTNWATNEMAGYVVTIVDGPGMGQSRTITANTANTLTINQPWDVNPTGDSWYTIATKFDQKYLIKGNLLQEVPRGIWIGYASNIQDIVVADNTLIDAEAIYLRADIRPESGGGGGIYDVPRFNVLRNIYIEGNTLTNIRNWYPAKIVVQTLRDNDVVPAYGNPYYNVVVRDNIINAHTPNSTVNDYNEIGEGYFVNYSVGGTGSLGVILDGNTAAALDVGFHLHGAKQAILWNSLAPGTTELAEVINSPGAVIAWAEAADVPVVSVTASDAVAGEEANNTGAFTVTRSETGGALTVNYTVAGTATNGADYNWLSGSVVIPSDQLSATITVVPIDDLWFEGDESLTLTLAGGLGYSIGAASQATITIGDNDGAAVYDPFDDGGRTNGADEHDVAWYSNEVSSGTATALSITTDSLLNGSTLSADNPTVSFPTYVHRAIVGQFDDRPITLANVGDYIYLMFDFRLAGALSTSTENRFRFGLYDSKGTLAWGDDATATRDDDGYWAQTSYGPTSSNTGILREDGDGANAIFSGPGILQLGAEESDTINDNAAHTATFLITRTNTNELTLEMTIVDSQSVEEVHVVRVDSSPVGFTFDEIVLGMNANELDYRVDNVVVGSNTIVTSTPDTTTDLVAHWTFDDGSGSTAADSAPFGSVTDTGTLMGDAALVAGIGLTDALKLDGAGHVGVLDSADINLQSLTTQRTISAWVYVDDASILAHKQVIYEEGDADRGLNMYVYNGQLYVGGWNTPVGESAWAGTFLAIPITSGQWHHVALTLDGDATVQAGALRGYLDGAEFSAGAGSQLWSHSGDIGIGRADGASDGPAVVLGDLTGDGIVDGLDIDPFVQVLTGALPFNAAADVNGDLVVDGLDIDPFVTILTGGSATAATSVTKFHDGDVTADGDNFIGYIDDVRVYQRRLDGVDIAALAADTPVDVLVTVTIAATDGAAGEAGPNTGTFTVTRTGAAGNLTVHYTVSGTATNGVDYSSLSGSVVIADGQASAAITVTPIDDLLVEGNETVIVTLATGSGYLIGAQSSGTVTIADNDSAPNGVVQNGLMGHWQLNEGTGTTVSDSSGNGLTGTFVGLASSAWSTGKYDGGLYLANPNNPPTYNHVDFGDHGDVINGISIGAWVKPTVVTTLYMIVAKTDGDVVTNRAYYLGINESKVRAYLAGDRDSSGGYQLGQKSTLGSATLTANQWVYLAMTWTGNATDPIHVYVNGVLDTNATVTGNDAIYQVNNSTEALRFGVRGAGTGYEAPYKGYIDEVTLYSRGLSAAEILQNYQYTGGATGASMVASGMANPQTTSVLLPASWPATTTALPTQTLAPTTLDLTLSNPEDELANLIDASQPGTGL